MGTADIRSAGPERWPKLLNFDKLESGPNLATDREIDWSPIVACNNCDNRDECTSKVIVKHSGSSTLAFRLPH